MTNRSPHPARSPRRAAQPVSRLHPTPTPALAGQFRSGRLSDQLPESLATWRVTTVSWAVAEQAAGLLGGTITRRDTDEGEAFDVVTNTAEVSVVVDRVDDLRCEMRRWDHTGLVHHCDGTAFLAPADRRGSACGCPASLAERRAKAREGRAPQAFTVTRFRLPELPQLGTFLHESLSWELAQEASALRERLVASGPAVFALRLTQTEFVGPGGIRLAQRRPVLDFVAPVAAALTSGLAACARSAAEAARAARTALRAVLASVTRACLGEA
ncbi:recombination directionality factor [Streptacidiphilus anmyonensis]|uniref:recombination directionality factor n=1 Tax=Streptacidiphilus anmyonensis TaxID=405782 RepID=UPI000693D01C|nr:hypothetical protein [Streptacidiphilus anmyonensis]